MATSHATDVLEASVEGEKMKTKEGKEVDNKKYNKQASITTT